MDVTFRAACWFGTFSGNDGFDVECRVVASGGDKNMPVQFVKIVQAGSKVAFFHDKALNIRRVSFHFDIPVIGESGDGSDTAMSDGESDVINVFVRRELANGKGDFQDHIMSAQIIVQRGATGGQQNQAAGCKCDEEAQRIQAG